jgi:hypothetical protein
MQIFDWKSEDKIFLPNSYEEWKERINYIKGVIRKIFIDYNLILEVEENKEFNGVLLDFYLEKFKLGIKINDLITRNSSKAFWGMDKITDKTPFNEWKITNELGIRVINAYEHEIFNENKWQIFKNMITYHCGLATRIFARNTKVVIVDNALSLKKLFLANNIQGYRNAKTGFLLVDKKTEEPLMCYTVGHAFFGKGIYDAEIARGCCITNYKNTGLGIQVIGGASKLWKTILNYYEDKTLDNQPGQINSIIYYTDSRYYNGKSISHLMDSNALPGKVETLRACPGFMNYWVETGLLKNREPMKHKEIMQKMKEGKILVMPNPGVESHCYFREK